MSVDNYQKKVAKQCAVQALQDTNSYVNPNEHGKKCLYHLKKNILKDIEKVNIALALQKNAIYSYQPGLYKKAAEERLSKLQERKEVIEPKADKIKNSFK